MSQRMPDYEALREAQARAQESLIQEVYAYIPLDDSALVQTVHDRKAKA